MPRPLEVIPLSTFFYFFRWPWERARCTVQSTAHPTRPAGLVAFVASSLDVATLILCKPVATRLTMSPDFVQLPSHQRQCFRRLSCLLLSVGCWTRWPPARPRFSKSAVCVVLGVAAVWWLEEVNWCYIVGTAEVTASLTTLCQNILAYCTRTIVLHLKYHAWPRASTWYACVQQVCCYRCCVG